MRIKLIVLLLVVVVGILLTAYTTRSSVADKYAKMADEAVQSGAESVLLANRVDDYSLTVGAQMLAVQSNIAHGLQCPDTQEALDALLVEQTPAVDENGAPVVDDLGRALDTEGRPIVERTSCRQTQHQATLNALQGWNDAQEEWRIENQIRRFVNRDIGFATPTQPSLIIVSDADGVVVARLGFDMADWFGPTRPNMSQFPVVGRTREPSLGPQLDVIEWRDNESVQPIMAQVASSAIWGDPGDRCSTTNVCSSASDTCVDNRCREYLGAVLVGHAVVNERARDHQSLHDVDIVYMHGQSGDLSFYGTTYEDRPEFVQAVRSAEFFEHTADREIADSAVTFSSIIESGLGGIYEFDYNGETFLLSAQSFAQRRADNTEFAGFFVVTSQSDYTRHLDKLNVIPLVGIALFLLAAIGILLIEKQFMRPIEQISNGIQEVIAGNKDYMWPVDEDSHMSDMAHSLNIMSARLQGKRDPDSEDLDGQNEWAGMVGGGGQPAKKPTGIAGLGGLRGRSAKKQDDDAES